MSTNVCIFGKRISHDITMMLHECHGASNHQSLHYLFNRFPSSKYIPLIKASNMDNFAMPWRLYDAMVQQNCTIACSITSTIECTKENLVSMEWAKRTAKRDEKRLCFLIYLVRLILDIWNIHFLLNTIYVYHSSSLRRWRWLISIN